MAGSFFPNYHRNSHTEELMITKPLLAESIKDPTLLNYPVFCTPKLGGIRALKINRKLLSRSFKPIQNRYIRAVLEDCLILPDGADGELMSGKTFSEGTGNIMRRDGSPDFTYYWFDFVDESLDIPYHERMKRLEAYYQDHGPWNGRILGVQIVLVLPKLISNVEELKAFEEECLAAGFEGVMVRYKCGRSSLKEGILLKLKPFEDDEAVITGWYELMHNTNEAEIDELGHTKRSSNQEGLVPSGMLGGYHVIGLKGRWENVPFDIGGFNGVSHEDRVKMWNECLEHPEEVLGRIVKYKYQAPGSKDKPRIPIYHGIRSPEDM